MTASGLPAGTLGVFVYSFTNVSAPAFGGTLVPAFDHLLLQSDDDSDGEIAVTVPGNAALFPESVFIQFIYVNAPTAPTLGLTNAIEIQFLGH